MGLWDTIKGGIKSYEDWVKGAVGGVTSKPGEAEQREALLGQGRASSNFADQGQQGFAGLGNALGGEHDYMRDIARGRQSVSAEQLRQSLQQQQAQMQSMSQGGPSSSAPMSARTAMLGAGRASSAMAGQQAVAGLQERQQAQQALTQALLQQRQQDMMAALQGRQNAISGYGGATPGKSLLEQWGPGVRDIATLATCDESLKTDVTDAGPDVDAMLDALHPVDFRYIDERYGTGPFTGVMAQDLQRSSAGARLVSDTPEGLAVDLERSVIALLAVVARLNERIRALEVGGK